MKDEIETRSDLNSDLMNKVAMTSLAVFEEMKGTLVTSLIQAAEEHNLGSGLYYIVLIDLSRSTAASSKMNKNQYDEWIKEFTKFTKSALNFSTKNTAVYLKTIGDGSIFLFRNFEDILEWKNNVYELCAEYNKNCDAEKRPDFHQYYFKTIVHLGEVLIDLKNRDARSFALNIIFKIEKQFQKDDLGITDAVRQAIIEEINSGRFETTRIKDFSDDDTNTVIPLWKLTRKNTH